MKRGRQSFYKISQQNETLLNQWCEDWRIGKNVSQTKGGREEVTIQNNYQRLKTICAFAEQKFKITDITKITEQQILEIFHDMDVGKFKKPNGKPYTTIANFQSRFKVFWGWWRKKNRKETGKDIPDITQDLLPERHRPDFTYLTKDEIEKLTNKANHDYKNLIWFYFDSGVRPQEGKKVLIKDIQVDDKNNCVWLNVRDEIAKKGKLWYRSRGLDIMEERFGKKPIQKFIQERLQSQKEVRVLEIGFGEGKCLLELRSLFPEKNVKLYGLNHEKRPTMSQKSDFLKNAQLFKVKTPKNDLPIPYFYDAGSGLQFNSSSLDVIISQVAFHYVADKAKLIEEIWRVLKPNGKAFLHIDSANAWESYPDFMKMNQETPRFIIYDGAKIILLRDFLNKYHKKGYNISFGNSEAKPLQRNLIITKNIQKILRLGLKLELVSTFDLTRWMHTDSSKIGDTGWWGTRSVYRMRRSNKNETRL